MVGIIYNRCGWVLQFYYLDKNNLSKEGLINILASKCCFNNLKVLSLRKMIKYLEDNHMGNNGIKALIKLNIPKL
jgi:hypothetical protein